MTRCPVFSAECRGIEVLIAEQMARTRQLQTAGAPSSALGGAEGAGAAPPPPGRIYPGPAARPRRRRHQAAEDGDEG